MTNLDPTGADEPVILFDGHCGLCNASVRFVLAHELQPLHRFAPLQSAWARERLAAAGRNPDVLDTVVLIDADGIHTRSEAALRVAATLRRPWRWLRLLCVVPRPLRDTVYRLIGRWRYTLFGRSAYCAVAGTADHGRFIADTVSESRPA